MALNSYHDGGDLLALRTKLYSDIQTELMNATVLFNNPSLINTFDIPGGAQDYTWRIRKELKNAASSYTHDGAGVVTSDPAVAYTGAFPVNDRDGRPVTVSAKAYRDSLDVDTFGEIDVAADAPLLARSIAKTVEEDWTAHMLGATLANADIDGTGAGVTTSVVNKGKRDLIRAGVNPADLVMLINEDSEMQFNELFGQAQFAGSSMQEAAVVRGQVGTVGGIPTVRSVWLDDGNPLTNTSILMTRQAFQVAESKGLIVDIRQHSTSLGFRTLAEYHANIATVYPAAAVKIITDASA